MDEIKLEVAGENEAKPSLLERVIQLLGQRTWEVVDLKMKNEALSKAVHYMALDIQKLEEKLAQQKAV